jgi:hypothetical protein
VDIQGGISDKEDHSLLQRVVAESYEGKVYGNLMHVPAERAYRYPTKGVAMIDGQWRNILSNRKTVLLQRLFTFPEALLARALALAPAGATWLDDPARGTGPAPVAKPPGEAAKPETGTRGEGASRDGAPGDGKVGTGGDAEGGKPAEAEAGKTAVGSARAAKDGASAAGGPAVQPRFVRVEAPPQEALKHFLEVQNSGCLSAG